jgi:hypothetical protein
MLVDNERVLLELKRHVASKSHHGQRDLLAEIARLETRNQLEEGLPERALRLYGVGFSEDLLRPSSVEGRVPLSDGENVHALRGDSHRGKADHVSNGRAGKVAG